MLSIIYVGPAQGSKIEILSRKVWYERKCVAMGFVVLYQISMAIVGDSERVARGLSNCLF